MTYYQVGNQQNNCTKRPIVEFSPNENRANLMSMIGATTLRRKRSRSVGQKRRRTRRVGGRKTRVTKVRVINGRVALRIGGFPGVQRVGASQLVRFVPLNKLRLAAKRVLGRGHSAGGNKRQRRRRRRNNRRRA